MKATHYCVPLILLFTAVCSPNRRADAPVKTIPYPKPLPDSVPLSFLPGIVSGDSVDFNAAFSPDGTAFYFTRSIQKRSRLFFTHHTTTGWTIAVPVPFTASDYSEADPAFAPDGTLYFISNRPQNVSDTLKDYNIWFVRPLPAGGWSAPENFKLINSDSAEYYISFAGNGNLYFASSRAGGFGAEDIYVSRMTDGRYTTPENLGSAINTEKPEYDPFISGTEDHIVFTSSNRDDSFGGGDLYHANARNGHWEKVMNAGPAVNTPAREYCAYYTPDHTYFFFSSNNDVKWIRAAILNNPIQP